MKYSTVNVTEKHHLAILVIYFLLKKIMSVLYNVAYAPACSCFIQLLFQFCQLHACFFFFCNAGRALSFFNKMNLFAAILSLLLKKKRI